MKIKKIKAYQCNSCEELHRDEQGALECCPGIEEVDGYECPECTEMFDNEDDAKECCEE